MDTIKGFVNELKEIVAYYMAEFSFQTGIVFILIGILILRYQLKRNNSFKMSEYGVLSWKALVNIWAIIFILFMIGIGLIFRN